MCFFFFFVILNIFNAIGCEPGCFCDEGYILDVTNDEKNCIKEEDCTAALGW
jgi:hypothetical protein